MYENLVYDQPTIYFLVKRSLRFLVYHSLSIFLVDVSLSEIDFNFDHTFLWESRNKQFQSKYTDYSPRMYTVFLFSLFFF